jgi:hypothetical protein
MIVLAVVQTAILIILCVLVAGLLRAYATVLRRLHQLEGPQDTSARPFRTADGVMSPPGRRSGPERAPQHLEMGPGHDIVGEGLAGEVISVRTVGTDVDTVLVFLSSGCAGCTGFWDDLLQRKESSIVGDGRLLVVAKDAHEESVGLLRELCPDGVDLVMSSQAWGDYGVPGSPYVIVVDGRSGTIRGEGSGTSLTQVSGLVHQAFGDRAVRRGGSVAKPRADADREVDVDRVLLQAGISPGDPSLYGSPVQGRGHPGPQLIGFPGHPAEDLR